MEKLGKVSTRMHDKGEQLIAYILRIGQLDDAMRKMLVERVGQERRPSSGPGGILHDTPRFLERKVRKKGLPPRQNSIHGSTTA